MRQVAGFMLVLTLLVYAPVVLAAESESVPVLLQKGIHLEETVGDLDGAIEVYEQIVKEADARRADLAQAHLRLGICLLKKGRESEAHETLERLIAQYPDQTRLVAEARKRLPAPEFPEIDGCRLVEKVSLKLEPTQPGWREAEPQATITIPAYSILDVEWSIDAGLAEQVAQFLASLTNHHGTVKLRRTELSCRFGEAVCRNTHQTEPSHGIQVGKGKLLVGGYKSGNPAIDVRVDDKNLLAAAMAEVTVEPLPYTQIMINDIQRDGTIRFRSIMQQMNDGIFPVTSKTFINSDFVNVEKMTDEFGQPLDFSTSHQDGHYRYHVTLNDEVEPGEPLIYSSEGTITGLISATNTARGEFRYRMRHHPSVHEPTRRIEIYRLPKGAELIDTRPEQVATREVLGRTEVCVRKMIPPRGSLTTEIRYRLPGAELATKPAGSEDRGDALKLRPAPWSDGERMELQIVGGAGVEIGTIIYTAESVKVEDKPAWRIESSMGIPMSDMFQYTRVDAEKDTFRPLTSVTSNNMLGDYRAEFAAGRVQLAPRGGVKAEKRSIDVDGVVYDNEQVLYLIRRLPLAVGYETTFSIFPVIQGHQIPCTIEVTETEKIEVPAGRYDCYKLSLSLGGAAKPLLRHTLWISNDEHRYLVKYDSKSALMQLADAEVVRKQEPRTYKNEKFGFTLELPAGWDACTSYARAHYKLMLYLLSPDLETWALLTAASRTGDVESARRVADGDIEILEQAFEGYTVRSDSWSEKKINGLPAAHYVADYEEDGEAMVEYRTYVLDESLIYWFVFRIEKDQFEEQREVYDKLIASFQTAGVASKDRP